MESSSPLILVDEECARLSQKAPAENEGLKGYDTRAVYVLSLNHERECSLYAQGSEVSQSVATDQLGEN